MRNCAVIMIHEEFFKEIVRLTNDPNFAKVMRRTAAGEIKQKKLEFVMRFLSFKQVDVDPVYDVEEFIDAHIVDLFFFQAEDGIRDGTVTGVQTCALPI